MCTAFKCKPVAPSQDKHTTLMYVRFTKQNATHMPALFSDPQNRCEGKEEKIGPIIGELSVCQTKMASSFYFYSVLAVSFLGPDSLYYVVCLTIAWKGLCQCYSLMVYWEIRRGGFGWLVLWLSLCKCVFLLFNGSWQWNGTHLVLMINDQCQFPLTTWMLFYS